MCYFRAAKIQGSLSCVWKLMGDSCMVAASLSTDIHFMVCSSLLGQRGDSTNMVKINLGQLLQLATRSVLCDFTTGIIHRSIVSI